MAASYCLFLIVSFPLCHQPNQARFKIVITAERPTVVAGADVWIKVSLTNTSSNDVNERDSYMTGIDLDSTFRFEAHSVLAVRA